MKKKANYIVLIIFILFSLVTFISSFIININEWMNDYHLSLSLWLSTIYFFFTEKNWPPLLMIFQLISGSRKLLLIIFC